MKPFRVITLTLFCLCVSAALLYFVSYKTAKLMPTGPGTYDLSVLGITIPYTDATRIRLAIIFSPLRITPQVTTTVTGTVVFPLPPIKGEMSLRQVDGTLIGLLVPSQFEETVSRLKEGDQVTITYGLTPDDNNLFLQRYVVHQVIIPGT
ncbi:MAG: hypothetical protein ACOYM3_18740 [Terrimicrobiaceae bacterium]